MSIVNRAAKRSSGKLLDEIAKKINVSEKLVYLTKPEREKLVIKLTNDCRCDNWKCLTLVSNSSNDDDPDDQKVLHNGEMYHCDGDYYPVVGFSKYTRDLEITDADDDYFIFEVDNYWYLDLTSYVNMFGTKLEIDSFNRTKDKTVKFGFFDDVEESPQNQKTDEENTMSRAKKTGAKVLGAQKESATLLAKLAVGDAANIALKNAIQPKLPESIAPHLDTAYGSIVLASVAIAAVNQFAPDNDKAAIVSQAMLDNAYIELGKAINLDGIIESIVGSVSAKDLEKLSE